MLKSMGGPWKKKFPIWLCAMDIKYINIVLHLPGNISWSSFPFWCLGSLSGPEWTQVVKKGWVPLVVPGDSTLSSFLSRSVDLWDKVSLGFGILQVGRVFFFLFFLGMNINLGLQKSSQNKYVKYVIKPWKKLGWGKRFRSGNTPHRSVLFDFNKSFRRATDQGEKGTKNICCRSLSLWGLCSYT